MWGCGSVGVCRSGLRARHLASMKQLLSPNRVALKPFIKWAGGKSQLLDQLATLYPPQFNGYHEPFIGSGAVFFDLYARRSLKRARLTDSNAELINCFSMIRDRVDDVIVLLARHKKRHSSEHYYEIRAQNPERLDTIERAARFIYLNKTCYNGLYRVNSKGQFNVPMGRYKNPGIFDPEELHKAGDALTDIDLAVSDFRDVIMRARKDDFVYLDPPYHPITKTSNFTSYTQNAFGEQEQRALAQLFRGLDTKGCQVMLSNSWTPFVRDLYEGYSLIEVKANRAINSNSEKRGKISELVVLNYDPQVDG